MLRVAGLAFVIAAALTGCASPIFDVGRTETVLPLSRAWIDGMKVDYITTDVSDAAMARMLGVNHVPRLAQAARAAPADSLLERVYKFPNEEQISIFQSAPQPVGGDNQDRAYSPLWRLVLVRWADPKFAREIKSEEGVLAAQDLRELSLEVTDIVVNCPVVRSAGGGALKGVR